MLFAGSPQREKKQKPGESEKDGPGFAGTKLQVG